MGQSSNYFCFFIKVSEYFRTFLVKNRGFASYDTDVILCNLIWRLFLLVWRGRALCHETRTSDRSALRLSQRNGLQHLLPALLLITSKSCEEVQPVNVKSGLCCLKDLVNYPRKDKRRHWHTFPDLCAVLRFPCL